MPLEDVRDVVALEEAVGERGHRPATSRPAGLHDGSLAPGGDQFASSVWLSTFGIADRKSQDTGYFFDGAASAVPAPERPVAAVMAHTTAAVTIVVIRRKLNVFPHLGSEDRCCQNCRGSATNQ